jgi:hypothetical protein
MGALRWISDIRRSNYSAFRPAKRWLGGQYAETINRFQQSARIARGDKRALVHRRTKSRLRLGEFSPLCPDPIDHASKLFSI